MIRGSCYCGAVKFELNGRLLMFAYCHCPDCRKFTGSAFASVIATEADGFNITAGEDNLTAFQSSPGKQRSFCRTCGCNLFLRAEHRPGMIFVRAGSLDDDPAMRPQAHFWVSQKAPWYNICDDIPQHPEGLAKK